MPCRVCLWLWTPERLASQVKNQDFGFGWNAATGEYADLFDEGVIDPATVTQQAVINSCSIAASVLTTQVLITEVKEKVDPMAAMGGDDGMGGGMPPGGGMGGGMPGMM